mmetsp:Transcript_6804/g.11968  ORF Transcript_6804/g.11968 Transcript_6804/m.11968 type:complete len:436 (+) Transcript_6804:52-1359(+)
MLAAAPVVLRKLGSKILLRTARPVGAVKQYDCHLSDLSRPCSSGAARPPRSQHLRRREPTQPTVPQQASTPSQSTSSASSQAKPSTAWASQPSSPADQAQPSIDAMSADTVSSTISSQGASVAGRAAATPLGTSKSPSTGSQAVPIVRYGPENVDLKPQDQLRPMLPTWNPPPTRLAQPEDLKQGVRVRFLFDERWWAAAVREDPTGGDVKVGFEGWPARHDEMVGMSSGLLYLHESFHEEYVAAPIPARYKKPIVTDEDGNPVPAAPRPARPKVFDPEKERMKRALRPPLPYNPEKERLKRQLRGQTVPPVEISEDKSPEPELASEPEPAAEAEPAAEPQPAAGQTLETSATSADSFTGGTDSSPAPPAAASEQFVAWEEVVGGVDGKRAFRHTRSGEVTTNTPAGGWVEIRADGNACYYWHPERNITTWDRPA